MTSKAFKSFDLKPLIPVQNRYRYKPKLIRDYLEKISDETGEPGPQNLGRDPISDIVLTLCSAAKTGRWNETCEQALVDTLPVREHHAALISHNLMVTGVGALVARALQETTRLDLLADRYFVRRMICHDSSKTSSIEASSYSGIIAVHLEQNNMLARRSKATESESPLAHAKAATLKALYDNVPEVLTAMANIGFEHHYEKNPHHPEHFADEPMNNTSLVESIVDGLAVILERQKPADVEEWLGAYNTQRYTHEENVTSANAIIRALGESLTTADYAALVRFRAIVLDMIGESAPWMKITFTGCLKRK